MLRGYLLFLLIIASVDHLAASNDALDAAMVQAEIYFNSGDYVHARSLYEAEMDDRLEPWEVAILNYNIGTTLMAQEKLDESIAYFEKAKPESKGLPLLLKRLSLNLSEAQILLTKRKFEEILTNRQATLNDYLSLLKEMRGVLETIDYSQEASCKLDEAEGAPQCEPSLQQQKLLLEGNIVYNELLGKYFRYYYEHIDTIAGISLILSFEELLLTRLDVMVGDERKHRLVKEYVSVYKHDADSWQPLWEILLNRHKKGDLDEEQREELNRSYRAFLKSTSTMQSGDIERSKEDLENSMKGLLSLQKLLVHDQKPEVFISHLIVDYLGVLGFDPIQEISLMALFKMQEVALIQFPKEVGNEFSAYYADSLKYLSQALQSLREGKELESRFYVEMSLYNLMKIKSQNAGASTNPESSLKWAIQQQNIALDLTSIIEEIKGLKAANNLGDGIFQTAISQIQSEAISTSKAFGTLAQESQQKEFATGKNDKSIPWDEIIPLVVEGGDYALKAKSGLDSNGDLQMIKQNEGMAIAKWKQALALMRIGKSADQDKQEEKPESSPSNAEAKEVEDKAKSHNDVLRLIQEMEVDDRSKSELLFTPNTKREERPW